MRVLLVAESANPEWVSVPLVGWAHSRAIASLVDAHLVTQVRNRGAITRAGLGADQFTAIDSEVVAKWVAKLASVARGGRNRGWTTAQALSSISYYFFEHLVWRQFGARIASGEFDVVHRLTPVSPAKPSLLASWCKQVNAPFVLGPINGGVPWPKHMKDVQRREGEWLSCLRPLRRLLPGHLSMLRDASAILVGSRTSFNELPRIYKRKAHYLPENAIDPARFWMRRTRTARVPLRLVFAGRLVPLKGVDILIEAAMPLVDRRLIELTIVGDGPEMQSLRDLASDDGRVDRGIRFTGWVDHRALQQEIADSDLFVLPSIREFGGAVVMEAMAVGSVPVVVDYAGPGETVTDDVGYRVPLGSRAELVASFRALFERLLRQPEEIDDKSRRAWSHAREELTWEAKARRTVSVYRNVIANRNGVASSGPVHN